MTKNVVFGYPKHSFDINQCVCSLHLPGVGTKMFIIDYDFPQSIKLFCLFTCTCVQSQHGLDVIWPVSACLYSTVISKLIDNLTSMDCNRGLGTTYTCNSSLVPEIINLLEKGHWSIIYY